MSPCNDALRCQTHGAVVSSGLMRDTFGIRPAEKRESKGEKSEDQNGGQSAASPDSLYRVIFAEMQRMHLRKLQIKLVRHAVYVYKEGREPGISSWEGSLAEYSGSHGQAQPVLHNV